MSGLVDEALHRRTVDDEGVAGLTQETLQVPVSEQTHNFLSFHGTQRGRAARMVTLPVRVYGRAHG